MHTPLRGPCVSQPVLNARFRCFLRCRADRDRARVLATMCQRPMQRRNSLITKHKPIMCQAFWQSVRWASQRSASVCCVRCEWESLRSSANKLPPASSNTIWGALQMVFHFVTFQFIQPFPGLHRAQGDIKELTNAVKPELPQNHTPAPSKTLFNARLHNPNGHKGAQRFRCARR